MAKTAIVIPARYQSTRLPGKPLVDIGGESMIKRVYDRAQQSRADQVYVATDHPLIVDEVESWGGQCILTGDLPSGTDRVAVVARELAVDYVVNVQGDEPLIDPAHIDLVISKLEAGAAIASIMTTIDEETTLFDYNCVKVVVRADHRALYFSRQAIPAHRDLPYRDWLQQGCTYYQHVGIYGFSRATLLELVDLPMGDLEGAESLEQLRWLQAGYDIYMSTVDQAAKGVDTAADLERVRATISPP